MMTAPSMTRLYLHNLVGLMILGGIAVSRSSASHAETLFPDGVAVWGFFSVAEGALAAANITPSLLEFQGWHRRGPAALVVQWLVRNGGSIHQL
jgi:hypothetical protein